MLALAQRGMSEPAVPRLRAFNRGLLHVLWCGERALGWPVVECVPSPYRESCYKEPGRGFGDTWNRYAFSVAEFNGQVYTSNWKVQFDYPRPMALR